MNLETTHLDALAAHLLARAGLKIGPERRHVLRRAYEGRMAALGLSEPSGYLRLLRDRGPSGEMELQQLLPWVTVGTTYFFRDAHQFRALEHRLVPDLLRAVRSRGSPGRIWSAGCASGEEPYSLAMLLAEAGARPSDVEIWATDVNPEAVESARRGQYRERKLAGLPGKLFEKYFHRDTAGYAASDELRSFIRFERQNLIQPALSGVAAGSFDLILCRNVIIYFDLPTVRGLMDRFRAALRPDGYLLLGYSESLFQIYDRLEMVEVEGAFIYRPARPVPDRNRVEPMPEEILPAITPPSVGAAKPPRLDPVRAAATKMEQGDFQGALSDLEKQVKERPEELAAWLTLGNARSLFGRLSDARDAFSEVIGRDPLCVEARLYGGMAAMQAGSMREARAELTRAVYLEPTLALGHYLLAQVEERLGERDEARRSYRNALALVSRTQRALKGYFPDMADSLGSISAAARCALDALEGP